MTPPSLKKYRSLFADRAFTNNLVLVEGVGLCPLIGGATTLKAGVTLFVCTMITLILTSLLMLTAGRKLPNILRIPVHALCAVVLLCGEAWYINKFISTELFASLYLYLPLLSVTTLFAYHGERTVGDFDPTAGLLDAFASSFGFGIVICIVGAARELFARRTLWGKPVPLSVDLPEASLPFAAFLLLGLMAALLQRGKNIAEAKSKQRDISMTGGADHE